MSVLRASLLIGLLAFASPGRADEDTPGLPDEPAHPTQVDRDWFQARRAFAAVEAQLAPRLFEPANCNSRRMFAQEQQVQIEYPVLLENYHAIRRFEASEWAVAALDRIATLQEIGDRRLVTMKSCPPPREVVKLGSEAIAIYREQWCKQLDDLRARTPTTLARHNFRLACQMAQRDGIESDFARHTCSHAAGAPADEDVPSKKPATLPPPPPYQLPPSVHL